MTSFIVTITAGMLALVINLIGIYIIYKFSHWGKKNVAYFMSFAAGILIAVSFLHIIPTSFEMSELAPIFLLGGFFLLYLINRFIHTYVCHEGEAKHCTIGVIPAIGIGLHSFIDGIIFSVTFSVSFFTGVLAVIGMIMHEFPEGIITFLLLTRSGFTKMRSAIYAFIAAAVTTPLGVLVSWPFVSQLTTPNLGVLLSISAGALIYVGASHLLPEVEKEEKRFTILSLLSGIVVAIVIVLSHG